MVAFDIAIESTVNSIIVTVPPPATGRSTLPWYLKLVIVAESTDIVQVALETTRPGAAEAFLGVTAFFFAPVLAVPVADGLSDGDGLSVDDGLLAEAEADALGVAVGPPDVPGSAVGVGVAEVVGADDGDGVAVAVESVGDGLGLAEEPKQKMTRTQV